MLGRDAERVHRPVGPRVIAPYQVGGVNSLARACGDLVGTAGAATVVNGQLITFSLERRPKLGQTPRS